MKWSEMSEIEWNEIERNGVGWGGVEWNEVEIEMGIEMEIHTYIKIYLITLTLSALAGFHEGREFKNTHKQILSIQYDNYKHEFKYNYRNK